MPEQYDVLIVGGGPVGLFGAYYAGVRGLRVAVIDSLSQLGGQVTAMYPEKQIYDIAGYPQVSGRELVANLVAQAGQYEPTYILGEEAQDIALGDGPPHVVTTSSGRQIHAGAVIVTGGIGTFTPRPLPAGEDFLGSGLEYFVPSIAPYAGKDVVIVGGGDSAVEEATFLTKFARSVTIVHRRDELRASKIMAERALANEKIKFAWNSAVEAIHGEDKLAGITVRDTQTGELSELPVTGLFIAIGHDPRNELVKGTVELDAEGYVVCEGRSTRTNVTGVFACGDLVDHTYRQAITAAGSGCAAALDAERFLAQ